MDIVNNIRVEFDGSQVELRPESSVPVADTGNPLHAVEIPQSPGDGTNHIVQPGAKPAAGNDRRMGMAGREIDFFPGTGNFQHPCGIVIRSDSGGIDGVGPQYVLIVPGVVGNGIPQFSGIWLGGRDFTGSQG